jgi:hypothetical protein
MDVRDISIKIDSGGASEDLAISGVSAQSAAITAGEALVTPTVDCFVRQGSNPTALADGTDIFLLANVSVRLSGILNGYKLAFITSGAAGTVYISPGA